MLSLDSPRWKELRHAYGAAIDTPRLLQQLYSYPSSEGESEPWFTLWSSLAHQGDVYSASFAAVPYIVDAVSKGPEKACFDYFQFPAWVEICRNNNNVTVPADLLPAYTEALRRLPTLLATAASREWDEGFARVLSQLLQQQRERIRWRRRCWSYRPISLPISRSGSMNDNPPNTALQSTTETAARSRRA